MIGLYFTFFIGMAPFGNLITGWLASHIGLRQTLMINGAVMAVAGLIAQIWLSRGGARQALRESINL
ncbi:MAG: hypothetical protein R3D67_10830 [Hyphomicrobiaceae bacterium]